MGGVAGRQLASAYARCNTWGTPASVTKQFLLTNTSGLDSSVGLVDDETFNQDFLAEAEVGDHSALSNDLPMVLRYEDTDTFLAAAMGSAATPTVVSSQASNSLVAYSHVVTLAPSLGDIWFTLAVDMINYVQEIPSFKLRGYNIRVGDNGRMMVSFPIVGNKAVYDSTTNTRSTVGGATAATTGNRAFRKDGRFRINVQSAGSLGSSDLPIPQPKEIAFNTARPMVTDDLVFNQDYIIAPDDNDYPEFSIEVTYPRMNTVTANSLATAVQVARTFKADWFFQGPYVNSTTRRSFLWEFPALQLYSFKAPASGPGQVRPTAMFRAKKAAAAPSGMSGLTLPFRLTIVNSNSQTLI